MLSYQFSGGSMVLKNDTMLKQTNERFKNVWAMSYQSAAITQAGLKLCVVNTTNTKVLFYACDIEVELFINFEISSWEF